MEGSPAPKRPRAEAAEDESGAGSLAAVTAAHEAWTAQFVEAHGRRPAREDIEADPRAKGNAERATTPTQLFP